MTAGTVRTGDDEAAERVAETETLVPKLAVLDRPLPDANTAQLNALRSFATNQPDLQHLEEVLAKARLQTAEFNLFELLNLSRREDTHSRILTWLLDPNNNHNVGDYFLTEFLRASHLSVYDVGAGWSRAESQREWYSVVDGRPGWLDILLLNTDAQLLCAIENKIYSSEGTRQLTHYRKALERQYPNYKRHYVFLSPSGIDSRREEEQRFWRPMSYSNVLEVVEQTLVQKAAVMSEETSGFLQQYATVLRRRIVPETDEVAALARRIYIEHREMIELIYRHRPNYQAETNQILRDEVQNQDDWKLDDDTNARYVRFLASEWDVFKFFRTGTGWPSKAVMLFEFHCQPGKHGSCLVLSPSEESLRSVLFQALKRHPRLFNRTKEPLRDGYHHVHCEERILDDSDFDNWFDADSQGPTKLKRYVADFAQHEFPAMNEVIVNCFRDYEKGTASR